MISRPGQTYDYWTTAREPWPSLLFVLPFLVVYEVSAFAQSSLPAARNGADLWIRQIGNQQGFAGEWIFPLLAPMLLMLWQFVGRRPWKWSFETLGGMFAESLMFAMTLVFLGQLTALMFPLAVPPSLTLASMTQATSFLGAGIYEEMVFRLLMLPLLFLAFRAILAPVMVAMLGSVLISSWLFATAHYVDTTSLFSPTAIHDAMNAVVNTPELWFSYSFRFLAGVLFSALFWFRGFGIAVGCHILYDLIVGVVLAEIGQ